MLEESPYKGGYDLTIGTSERGEDVSQAKLPPFKHLLVVFGGVAGIEQAVEVRFCMILVQYGTFRDLFRLFRLTQS